MKRVLIVDDAAFMRMTIKNMLSNYEYEIVGEAENGLEAVEKYKELSPDIVTMDITMPELDGIQALRMIKKINSTAIIYGAKGFIVKPFKEEILLGALSKL